MKIIVTDVETTGTDTLKDDVVEIAIVVFEGGKEIFRRSDILFHDAPMDPGAQKVHGITPKMIKEHGVKWDNVGVGYHAAFERADVHCAFNSDFDFAFLKRYFARIGLDVPVKPMIDPFWIAQRFIPSSVLRNKNLSSLCGYFGIEVMQAHRAVDDTYRTGVLLYSMLEDMDLDINELLEPRAYTLGPLMKGIDPFEALYCGHSQRRG